VPTEIDAVHAQSLQTLGAGRLTVGVRAVEVKATGLGLVPELGGQEDFVTLARAFEPLAEEVLIVPVETVDL